MNVKRMLLEELNVKEADEITEKIIDQIRKLAPNVFIKNRLIIPRAFKVKVDNEEVSILLLPFKLKDGEVGAFAARNNKKTIYAGGLFGKELARKLQDTIYHEVIHLIDYEKAGDKSSFLKKRKAYITAYPEFNALIHELQKLSTRDKALWNNLRNYKEIMSAFGRHSILHIPRDVLNDKNFIKRVLTRISREKFLPKKFQQPLSDIEKKARIKIKEINNTIALINSLPISKKEKDKILEKFAGELGKEANIDEK